MKIDKSPPVIDRLDDVYGWAIAPLFKDDDIYYSSGSATVYISSCNNLNCYFYTDMEISDVGSGVDYRLQTFETDGVGGDYIPSFTKWTGSTFWGANWWSSTRSIKAVDKAGNESNIYYIYYYNWKDDFTCKQSGNDMYYYDPNNPNYVGVRTLTGIKCGK